MTAPWRRFASRTGHNWRWLRLVRTVWRVWEWWGWLDWMRWRRWSLECIVLPVLNRRTSSRSAVSPWGIAKSWRSWEWAVNRLATIQYSMCPTCLPWKWLKWEAWSIVAAISILLHWNWEVSWIAWEWWIDLPNLKSLLFGCDAFANCCRVVMESECFERRQWIDLPELTSIQLGTSALRYSDEADDTTLIMRGDDSEANEWIDLPKLTSLITVEAKRKDFCFGDSFEFLYRVILESMCLAMWQPLDIPSLTTVDLKDAFSGTNDVLTSSAFYLCLSLLDITPSLQQYLSSFVSFIHSSLCEFIARSHSLALHKHISPYHQQTHNPLSQ